MAFEIAVLVLFAAVAAFWFDAMRAREAALSAAQRAAENADCQFLDATVALASLRLAREGGGMLRFRRIYRFEFSDDGMRRLPGTVTLFGRELERIEMAPHREAPPTWTIVQGGRDDRQ